MQDLRDWCRQWSSYWRNAARVSFVSAFHDLFENARGLVVMLAFAVATLFAAKEVFSTSKWEDVVALVVGAIGLYLLWSTFRLMILAPPTLAEKQTRVITGLEAEIGALKGERDLPVLMDFDGKDPMCIRTKEDSADELIAIYSLRLRNLTASRVTDVRVIINGTSPYPYGMGVQQGAELKHSSSKKTTIDVEARASAYMDVAQVCLKRRKKYETDPLLSANTISEPSYQLLCSGSAATLSFELMLCMPSGTHRVQLLVSSQGERIVTRLFGISSIYT